MSEEQNKSILKKNPTILSKKALHKIYNELFEEGKISENGAAHHRMRQLGVSMDMRKKWADIKDKIVTGLVGSKPELN